MPTPLMAARRVCLLLFDRWQQAKEQFVAGQLII